MPMVRAQFTNTISRSYYPHTTTGTKKALDICPRCGKQAGVIREYTHKMYGCTMTEWLCPRCRHIWRTKKGENDGNE